MAPRSLIFLAFSLLSVLAAPSSTSKRAECLQVPKQYSTIQKAFDAVAKLRGDQCIAIATKTFSEQAALEWKGDTLTITGAGIGQTIIKASGSEPGGQSLSGSATLRLYNFGKAIKVQGIEVQNTYGKQGDKSQAVAINTKGDHIAVYDSKFTGYQDTAYLELGKQYFQNCIFVGATDFIFGGAAAWIEGGTIQAKAAGYISANRKDSQLGGAPFVFDQVKIESGGAAPGTVYLGRPWGDLATVQFQYCQLSDVIRPSGWDHSLNKGAKETFREYKNTGQGAASKSRTRAYGKEASAAISKGELWGNDLFA